MKNTLFTSLMTMALSLSATSAMAQEADFNVVPKPLKIEQRAGEGFTINADTRIVYTKGARTLRNANFLKKYIKERTGLDLPVTKKKPAGNYILLEALGAWSANPEGYKLSVDHDNISIQGNTIDGLFYGIQTLRKALPHFVINPNNPQLPKVERKIDVPSVVIEDEPRFRYRGAHLDVSRHFVTTDSICRFIDMLALHNINRMHWHITDDQGWRLEIKKYPRLTEVGSKRSETVIGHNSGRYDGIPYGGFYTQKECKALVKYAEERGVTIIPEIDLPGHMQGALAAYPELGCTGGPYEVWRQWGVSEDVLCAGNDKTLKFIDDVLDEVCKIFPSRYIHVGGDECPKTAWKACPKCQARIKAEGLEADGKHTAEERLQSYVIRHAEAHLSKKGRRMIGWDETLEGGLADGATVMSWRGEEGGIEAARQKHDVIMTPNTYLYFDYYQSLNTETEPDAIGGYLPLERVYSYEPVNDAMLAEGLDNFIEGVQANCWTEYMPTYRQIEYMELPRMAALAEVQWTQRDTKDYDDFLQRTINLMGLYDEQGYNYAQHIYDVHASYETDCMDRTITATLSTVLPVEIHYTLDGSEPTKASPVYEGPVVLDKDAQLRACSFRFGEGRPNSSARKVLRSNIEKADFNFNLATTSALYSFTEPAPRYTFEGVSTLVDGVKAKSTNFQSGQWIGYNGKDLDLVLDLGDEKEFSSVSLNTCVGKGDWIFDITGLEVAVCDYTDEFEIDVLHLNHNFTTVAKEEYPVDEQTAPDGIRTHTLKFKPVHGRYIRVKAPCLKAIPAWHTGRNLPAFIFVDEIEVK